MQTFILLSLPQYILCLQDQFDGGRQLSIGRLQVGDAKRQQSVLSSIAGNQR